LSHLPVPAGGPASWADLSRPRLTSADRTFSEFSCPPLKVHESEQIAHISHSTGLPLYAA
ncbi:hypothetical protein, partial [Streptomyces sp. NPDC059949]|uniref:hypothetical protein n=1 Tax=Streptomyces sp. NPDC059949 TaxID=3347013 RepID=UPI0036492848